MNNGYTPTLSNISTLAPTRGATYEVNYDFGDITISTLAPTRGATITRRLLSAGEIFQLSPLHEGRRP